MKIISIIGLGYVGLPLAVAFAKKYKVIGFDINHKRIEELNNGIPKGANWHKTLLLEMKTKISGIKNIAISEKLYNNLEEILRFRHIVRNSYGIFLDKKKTRDIANIVIKTNNELDNINQSQINEKRKCVSMIEVRREH